MTTTQLLPAKPKHPRVAYRPLHGVLLVDKAVGPSSHTVLARARRLWRAEKGGHTGTLDPLASGLLPLCFGAATKFAQVCLDADKTYRATLHLGQTREGGDLEGRVLLERAVSFSDAALRDVITRFTGAIDQVPPMQSALKHDGRPLYELARAGIEVVRPARRVTIHSITVVAHEGVALLLDVACSKGTYIRTLAEDIGEALGCGAHLSGLRRLASGPYHVDQAITLTDAELLSEADRLQRLLPVESPLQGWQPLALDADNAGRFLTGLRRRVTLADAANVCVYGPALPVVVTDGVLVSDAAMTGGTAMVGSTPTFGGAQFLGTAHISGGELIADRLLSPVEVKSMAEQRGHAVLPPTLQTTPQTTSHAAAQHAAQDSTKTY
jgi:tRNA pseudouridine55 synthase